MVDLYKADGYCLKIGMCGLLDEAEGIVPHQTISR